MYNDTYYLRYIFENKKRKKISCYVTYAVHDYDQIEFLHLINAIEII